jgi:hypothetical protein
MCEFSIKASINEWHCAKVCLEDHRENLSMRFLNLVTFAQLILICGLSKGVDIFILIVHFLNHNWEPDHGKLGFVPPFGNTP